MYDQPDHGTHTDDNQPDHGKHTDDNQPDHDTRAFGEKNKWSLPFFVGRKNKIEHFIDFYWINLLLVKLIIKFRDIQSIVIKPHSYSVFDVIKNILKHRPWGFYRETK